MNTFKTQLFLAVFCTFSFSLNSLGEEKAPCARAAVVLGKVINQKGESIKTGQTISVGTQLRTGESSLLKLVLKDDSIVDINSSSLIKISSCEGKGWSTNINLELKMGALRANVNKAPKIPREEFKLKTPTSILAVRGTEFFVSWQKDGSGQVSEQIGVSHGQVEVKSLFDQMKPPTMVETGTEFRAQGRIEEKGGEIKVEAKEPPKLDQFTASEQRKIEQETKVENRTFDQIIEIPAEGAKGPEAKQERQKAEGFLVAALKTEEPKEEKLKEERAPREESVAPKEVQKEARKEERKESEQQKREVASNPENSQGMKFDFEKKPEGKAEIKPEPLMPLNPGAPLPALGVGTNSPNISGIPNYVPVIVVWGINDESAP
jgi:hypothetical protein